MKDVSASFSVLYEIYIVLEVLVIYEKKLYSILFRNNLRKNIDIRKAIIVFISKTLVKCRISF